MPSTREGRCSRGAPISARTSTAPRRSPTTARSSWGTTAGEVVRIDTHGAIAWRTQVGGFVRGALSIARDGDVLAGCLGGPDAANGARRSRRERACLVGGSRDRCAREFGVHGGALEDARGAIYFGAQDDEVHRDRPGAPPSAGGADAPSWALGMGPRSPQAQTSTPRSRSCRAARWSPRATTATFTCSRVSLSLVIPMEAADGRYSAPRSRTGFRSDVVWALQTAESLWKRGERVDAVVWVRRAAQACWRRVTMRSARPRWRGFAADLGDWIGSHAVTGSPDAARKGASQRGATSPKALDALLDRAPPRARSGLGRVRAVVAPDVEVVSAKGLRKRGSRARSEPLPRPSDGHVMVLSSQRADVELIEEGASVGG